MWQSQNLGLGNIKAQFFPLCQTQGSENALGLGNQEAVLERKILNWDRGRKGALLVLKTKSNPVNFKDLTVFIQPFINWAASHLVNSRSSEEFYKMEDL